MSADVLLTGASGFLGANLLRVLLERGERARVLVRPTSDRRNFENLNGVEVVVGDLRDARSVDSAVLGCRTVYHTAAEYSFWSRNPNDIYENNVHGTVNVMRACRNHGVKRVVYTSTVGTIGLSSQPEPCDEATPMDPGQLTSHYKRSKLEAEKVALEYAAGGLPVVIVNPSAPIGPWDRKPTPTGKIIVDFCQGKLPAYLETGLNIIHVRDAALGHVLAAQKGRVGERYILGNRNMSLGEILGMLSKVTGLRAPKIKIPYGIAFMAGFFSTKISDFVTHRPPAIPLEAVKMSRRCMYFDSSKAVRELGLARTPVEKAFEEAVDWFAVNGYVHLERRKQVAWQSQ